MHHSPSKVQNAHHPCFVLQILCDNNEFDILSEPDKSLAVFRDMTGLYRCIFQLLRSLFLEHLSDYFELFLTEFARLTGEVVVSVEASNAAVGHLSVQSAYEMDKAPPPPALAPLYTVSEPTVPHGVLVKPSRDSAASTPSSNAFHNAFCSHSPSPTSAKKATTVFSDSSTQFRRSESHSEVERALYARASSKSESDQCSESEASDMIIGAMVRRKASPVVDSPVAQHQNDRASLTSTYNDLGSGNGEDDDDDDDDETNPSKKRRKFEYEVAPARRLLDLAAEADGNSEGSNDNSSEFISLRSSSGIGEAELRQVLGIEGIESSTTTKPAPVSYSSTWNLDNDFAVASGAMASSASLMSRLDSGTRAVKLHKDMLSSHSVVGQCDNKFIIATLASNMPTGQPRKGISAERQSKSKRLIVLFDQHALDERLNFEKYQSQFQASSSSSNSSGSSSASRGMAVDNSPQWRTTVSTGTVQLIHRAEDILRQWHFQYLIRNSRHEEKEEENGEEEGGDAHGAGDKGSCVVSLTETLQILDESLTINDFLEFVYYLHDQMHVLPMCALRPPAVTRILAFRACHSSVRFGDHLSSARCKDMVNQLQLTSFPFQCAHGRPSMVPLVEYVDDNNSNRGRSHYSSRQPNYSNIFNELAALDVNI